MVRRTVRATDLDLEELAKLRQDLCGDLTGMEHQRMLVAVLAPVAERRVQRGLPRRLADALVKPMQ
eukprot:6176287-Pleurochrysis_carterae.AAC.1